MNKRQKLVQQEFLNKEEAIIRRLRQVYGKALQDINGKIEKLELNIDGLRLQYDWLEDSDPSKEKIRSMIQSKIYQKQYQEALQDQIAGILEKLHTEEYLTVADYLSECYSDSFIGSLFDLHGQDVPLMIPLDQTKVVRAVQLDSKIKQELYTRLGQDVDLLKKRITAQVSRSVANGSSYGETARQLDLQSRIGMNNAIRIARTEGHRIQTTAAMDVMEEAKAVGADVVKQWDAALDGRTRASHRAVDGEIREVEEKFSNDLMYPGDPEGGAKEVINCRCALLQRCRDFLDEQELEHLKERADFWGLDKAETFKDFKQKYLKTLENSRQSDTISLENIVVHKSVGAASKNYPVRLPDGNHAKLAEGTEVTKVKAFAGAGTDTEIRERFRLETEYQIRADKWQKMRGDAYIVQDGSIEHVEIHWYEADGERVEMKVKRVFDDES